MNKTAKIIIGILILVCGFFFLYAQIKAREAQKQMEASILLQEEAIQLRERAENEAKRAERLAAESIEIKNQEMQIAKELKECRASK